MSKDLNIDIYCDGKFITTINANQGTPRFVDISTMWGGEYKQTIFIDTHGSVDSDTFTRVKPDKPDEQNKDSI